MGEYTNINTPLDQYDDEIHNASNGIGSQMQKLSEEELIFMINLSEQTNRPRDMMMFLGEYLKESIQACDIIEKNIADGKGKTEQDSFFLS